jgi:hypothetical protein
MPVAPHGASLDESSADDGDLVELKKELHEDVDRSFEKNMAVFQRKLDVQRRQLGAAISDVVIRQSNRLINIMSSGPHDHIIDAVRLGGLPYGLETDFLFLFRIYVTFGKKWWADGKLPRSRALLK